MTRWWSSAPIRIRLTVLYTAVLSLLLLVYASATFVAVRHEFREQLEDELHGQVSDHAHDAAARMDEQLEEILVVLVLGLPLTVVLAGAAGYVLAGRAIAPIERLVEQLRRFTADASHELRTPLAVIRGIGEMGLREPRTAVEYKEAMGSMLEEVDRLTRLVDTLLQLSRGDAGTVRLSRQPVDLGHLTREVVSSLAILAEERQQSIDLDTAESVLVSADRQVLRDAITNVVDNAIKYGPRQSAIDVRVRREGGDAVVSVADRGPGIAVEHRERIFDRFYRIDEGRSRESGGAGLGLAIAKWAVEANGGRISVDGAGPGSVFRIVLPMTVAS